MILHIKGVEFIVGGMYAYSMTRGRGINEENGEVTIDTWTPGSCPERFSVQVEVPEGYELTTEAPVKHGGSNGLSGRYVFGFRSIDNNQYSRISQFMFFP